MDGHMSGQIKPSKESRVRNLKHCHVCPFGVVNLRNTLHEHGKCEFAQAQLSPDEKDQQKDNNMLASQSKIIV